MTTDCPSSKDIKKKKKKSYKALAVTLTQVIVKLQTLKLTSMRKMKITLHFLLISILILIY